jgi:proline iminopeptidase
VYRIILFDQRNCGRSRPSASDTRTDLSANTTQHLIDDMERLREHLGVAQWMLFGGSWGTTLGLAYAQQHLSRVTAAVFFGITTTRRSEIKWLYRDVAPLFPEQWARFRAGVPEHERDGDLVAAYYHLLQHDDPLVRAQAASDWHDWEAASVSAVPNARMRAQWYDPDYQLTRARIVTHYFYHAAWLEEGVLLQNAHILAPIPAILVQGHLDLSAPLVTAWELSRAWTHAELVLVYGAGHSAGDAGMSEALVAATDQFAR